MHDRKQENGNTQLNSERNQVNDRISRYHFLGKAKKVIWDGARRNRTI